MNPSRFGGAAGVGGWVELGRTTLGSAADDITVSSLANKRYHMVLSNKLATGNANLVHRVGNGTADSGSNYARRASTNGGADGTDVNVTNFHGDNGAASATSLTVSHISNLSTKEKLHIAHSVGQGTAGAANAPQRRESVNKWANTANVIDVIQAHNEEAGSFNTNSEVVVLGWDPADTHTTNFWEELASVDLSGGAATSLSTGTFTAKKYLWVQVFGEVTGAGDVKMRMGNASIDTGSVYAGRTSSNGGADGTDVSQTGIQNVFGVSAQPTFINMFVVNNASNEKLIMFHNIQQVADGAATAPSRRESVWKYVNTSTQVNIMDILSTSSNLATNCQIKVWGSD